MLYFLLRVILRLICLIDLALFTIVMYVLAWFPQRLIRRFYQPMFHAWCRVFVRALGVDLKLHQHNTKSLPKQYILIGNHPSSFEDIGIPALFKVSALAKIEVKDWFIVGRISVAAGTLYVNRESKESRHQAKESIIAAVNAGTNISVYPEGGCKGRRLFNTFQYGAFDIAMKTNVPILPVFLHYECQDNFEWQHVPLLRSIYDIFFAQNKTANYHVFDPVYPDDFETAKSYSEFLHDFYLECEKRFLQ